MLVSVNRADAYSVSQTDTAGSAATAPTICRPSGFVALPEFIRSNLSLRIPVPEIPGPTRLALGGEAQEAIGASTIDISVSQTCSAQKQTKSGDRTVPLHTRRKYDLWRIADM